MTNANRLTIADARDALARGDLTSVELTDACLGAIDAAGALNAFVHHTPDMARDMARAAVVEWLGKLNGTPQACRRR